MSIAVADNVRIQKSDKNYVYEGMKNGDNGLAWEKLGSICFEASADWPVWTYHDDYDGVRAVIDNILGLCDFADFLQWNDLITKLPANKPTAHITCSLLHRILQLFEEFKESEVYDCHDENKLIHDATKVIQQLISQVCMVNRK